MASMTTMARRAQAAQQFDLGGASRGLILPQFQNIGPASLAMQRSRQRQGLRTFGFFSSLGKAFGSVAKGVVGAASGIAQIGFRATPLGQALAATGGIAPGLGTPGFGGALVNAGLPAGGLNVATDRSFAPATFVQSGGATAGAGCPPGFKLVRGRCVETGFRGTLERVLPGGETGLLQDDAGEAVMGGFGVPAMVPQQVGSVARRDGTVSPILRCIPGMVLGRDELCYNKGTIPRTFRKWPPGTKPPISAKDWKAAKTFGSVQKKIKRIAGDSGLSCAKKGTKRR